MASVLAFNLTQTDGHAPRKMNAPDLSTKLKLMGVDVASFGDYFADERMLREVEAAEKVAQQAALKEENGVAISTLKPSRPRPRNTRNDPIKCLTYRDPISATYRKYIFTADGSHLLGGSAFLFRSLPLLLVADSICRNSHDRRHRTVHQDGFHRQEEEEARRSSFRVRLPSLSFLLRLLFSASFSYYLFPY
jgi:hypothetical protein